MVLRRIAKALRPREDARVPDGQRVYAVGDLHGRLDLLNALLSRIESDEASRSAAETKLVFLGDLVDRGPDSRGVIERLIRLKEERPLVHVIGGNHDEVFLKAARGDIRALRFLTRIGGKETVLSYGIAQADYDNADYDALAAMLAAKVPAEHLTFLSGLEDYVEVGDFLFVHAGIRPTVPIAEQKASDLRWIRDDFLDCRTSHPRMIVHGHTITASPDIRSNRIGIDTGAFASGRLTAIGLEGQQRWFVTADGEPDPRWGSLSD